MVDELVDINRACAEMDATICSQGNQIKKMKQKNQALKAQIENNNWEELRINNKDMEVQLEKAMMFGGTHVDQPMSKAGELGQLLHLHVEVSDVEEVEERKQDPSLDDQTKSWWRRQADKVVRGMGTFRLHLKCCFGVRTRKRRVVQPAINNMHIAMPPVSVCMPPVSV